MNKTTFYDLPLYEPNDNASLIDGYNEAMTILDNEFRTVDVDVTALTYSIDNVVKESAEAKSLASTANANAASAISTANNANANATQALNTANTASANATQALNTANTASATANNAASSAASAAASAASAAQSATRQVVCIRTEETGGVRSETMGNTVGSLTHIMTYMGEVYANVGDNSAIEYVDDEQGDGYFLKVRKSGIYRINLHFGGSCASGTSMALYVQAYDLDENKMIDVYGSELWTRPYVEYADGERCYFNMERLVKVDAGTALCVIYNQAAVASKATTLAGFFELEYVGTSN